MNDGPTAQRKNEQSPGRRLHKKSLHIMIKRQLFIAGLLLVTLALRAPARAEDARPFPAPRNTQGGKDVLSTPEEALKSIQAPEGFRVSLFAAEPDVQQPIAIATDERGRLWVAENYTYGDAREKFVKDQRDRIIILEDTDGDGRFDKRTVFWDQADKLTSIEIGFGGVWVLCAPKLLFIPDKNRDDVPDGPPVVLLDGWDDDTVRHNVVNGLKWGPDGWLYGRHGIQATSNVGPPGATDSQRTRLNCSIWRYHPTRKTFEVVVSGGTNSWGADWDENGQMFFINTVIGHLWHVVPGAHYRRMYGADFNPHVYQLLEQTADHFHWDVGENWNVVGKGVTPSTSEAGGGHAHSGMMIYQGDNWPAQYRNTVFTINFHGRRLNNDRLQRQGAGYVGKHAKDMFFVGDQWFRGIELIYGPDGGVYVADWTDVGECHENDGVHRSSGRIFKFTYGTPKPTGPIDLSKLDDAALVALQSHKNDWYVRQSRRVLQERAAAGQDMTGSCAGLFAQMAAQPDVTRQLRGLWSLWCLDALPEPLLLGQLQHPSEHVRTWAVKLLVDRGRPSNDAVAALQKLARSEPSGLVQSFLASAMQRLPAADRWPLATALATRGEFADDPNLPLLVWYGIEGAVPESPEHAVSLAEQTRMPLVRRFISRRLTADLERQTTAVNSLVEKLGRAKDNAWRLDVLQGMAEAMRGWHKAAKPAAWDKATGALESANNADVQSRVRELSVVFGDGRAVDELAKIVANGQADVDNRRQALRALAETRAESLKPLLPRLMGDRGLVGDAIRAMASVDLPDAPRLIVRAWPGLDPDSRAAAIATLASRPAFAKALLDEVASGRIPRRDVSAFHARQIQSFGDESLKKQLAEVWGETRATDEEKQKLIAGLKQTLSAQVLAKADLSAGRVAFEKNCANCHVLYGQGKTIGPDLTGGNRRNLDYLLENLLDPSAQVAADFRMAVVELKSGRVVTGVVVEQSERTITLQTQTERVAIERSDIEDQKATTESLMPEGLLKTLSPDQVRDLIGYLMASGQVPLPKGAGERAAAP